MISGAFSAGLFKKKPDSAGLSADGLPSRGFVAKIPLSNGLGAKMLPSCGLLAKDPVSGDLNPNSPDRGVFAAGTPLSAGFESSLKKEVTVLGTSLLGAEFP